MRFSSNSFYCVPGAAVLPCAAIFLSFLFPSGIYFAYLDNQLTPFVLCVFGLFFVGSCFMFFVSVQQTLCSIQFHHEFAVCRIPFGKDVEIVYDKCSVGFDYHIQNGNKIWWIYLCYGKMPPYKNPHLGNRINSIQCQPGFIRIMYREEVYNALIEVLP